MKNFFRNILLDNFWRAVALFVLAFIFVCFSDSMPEPLTNHDNPSWPAYVAMGCGLGAALSTILAIFWKGGK